LPPSCPSFSPPNLSTILHSAVLPFATRPPLVESSLACGSPRLALQIGSISSQSVPPTSTKTLHR
jgi:hypothetical protein